MYGMDEQNDYYIILAAYSLKQWDLLLREGEAFLAANPSSMFYNGVKMWVSQGAVEAAGHKEKIHAADSATAPLLEKLSHAKGLDADRLRLEAAGLYSQAAMHTKALALYTAIDTASLSALGLTPDIILYMRFTCCYGLFMKKEAQNICHEMQTKWPRSDMLQATMTMMSMFPE